jgi:hypothetical protein
MASLRAAANCIGLTGPVSLVHDFFGFWTSGPRPLSLRTQLDRLGDRHIHVNFIAAGLLPDPDHNGLDQALQTARGILSTAGIGIGRVGYFAITGDELFDSNFPLIVDRNLLDDLSDGWSAPNDGIDVFVVHEVLGTVTGRSPVNGACGKSGKRSGMIIGASDGAGIFVGLTLAHEIGHFLGVDHYVDAAGQIYNDNLMSEGPTASNLLPWQIWVMQSHCMVRHGCAI